MDRHLSDIFWRAVADGNVKPETFTLTLLDHLLAHCSVCASEFESFSTLARKVEADPNAPTYGLLIQSAFRAVRAADQRLTDERERAKQDAATLLALDPASRKAKIRRARTRFGGTFFAQILLDAARERFGRDAEEALSLARCAEIAARRLGLESLGTELVARALAYQGNAARVLERWPEALGYFANARAEMRHRPVLGEEVLAEIDLLESRLARAKRRFVSARFLVDRALQSYLLASDVPAAIEARLVAAKLERDTGEPDRGLAHLEAALMLLHDQDLPWLRLCIHHNYADYLCDLDRFEEALAAFRQTEPLYESFLQGPTQLRKAWLEARIEAGFGEPLRAQALFSWARQGFVDLDRPLDASLVALEESLVLLRLGKTGEVRNLAQEIHQVFVRMEIGREALAAWTLFQQAVLQDAVDRALLRQVVDRLLHRAP